MALKPVPPKEKCRVYPTQSPTSRKTEFAREGDIEDCLLTVIVDIAFINIGEMIGISRTWFVTEEETVRHSTITLSLTDTILLPTYMRRRNVRMRIERIPQKVKEVWTVAAVIPPRAGRIREI